MNKTSTSNFGRMIVRGGVTGVLLEGENDFMDTSQSIISPHQNGNKLTMTANIQQYLTGVNVMSSRVESCTSPKTARFSTFQNNLRQSKRETSSSARKNILNLSNISRENIKQNTKNLKEEINDIDEEISLLQSTLIRGTHKVEQCMDSSNIINAINNCSIMNGTNNEISQMSIPNGYHH